MINFTRQIAFNFTPLFKIFKRTKVLTLLLIFCLSLLSTSCGIEKDESEAAEPLEVYNATPSDGQTSVDLETFIALRFNQEIDPTSILVSESGTTCTGNIQLSYDRFDQCVPFLGQAETVNNQTFRLTPAEALDKNLVYRIRVLVTVTTLNGKALSQTYEYTYGFTGASVLDTTSPSVVSLTPSEGENSYNLGNQIVFTFNERMQTSSLSGNTSDTLCSGAFQLSNDNFASCIKMAGLPVGSNENTTFTFTSASPLPDTFNYKIKLTTTAMDAAGNFLDTEYVMSSGFVRKFFATVSPLYSNAPDWNDYIRNDDASRDIYNAGNVACTGGEVPTMDWQGYKECIHSGEIRYIPLSGRTSCTGLTLSDQENLFDWSCIENPVRFITKQFKNGGALANLIDFSGTPIWRTNKITLLDGATVVGDSALTTWWSNPLVELNNGGNMNSSGTVYLVTSAISPANTWTYGADKTTLLIEPGITTSGTAASNETVVSASSKSFLWFEGSIDATGDNQGLHLNDVTYSVLKNTTISNGLDYGFLFNNLAYSRVENMESRYNGIGVGDAGVRLEGANTKGNLLSKVRIIGNRDDGFYIVRSSFGEFLDLMIRNNGGWVGKALRIGSASHSNVFNKLVLTNYPYTANISSTRNNTFHNVLAVSNNPGNSYGGFSISNTISTAWFGVTISNMWNDWRSAFRLVSNSNGIFRNMAIANVRATLLMDDDQRHHTFGDLALLDEGGYAALSETGTPSSGNNYYTGLLRFGVDANRCTNGGSSAGFATITCAPQGQSDFTYGDNYTAASSFVEKITSSDSQNSSTQTGDGRASYTDITDWSQFENPYRTWGKDGGVYPASSNEGPCIVGTCRLWDWSLKSTDTVLRDVLPLPTGNDIDRRIWDITSTSCVTIPDAIDGPACNLPGLYNQGSCEAVTGDWTTNKCHTIYLRRAVEISEDGIGNDNILCESNETCLYTPNIGAYQGHGNLISAGAFTDGTLSGITLLKYDTNGR